MDNVAAYYSARALTSNVGRPLLTLILLLSVVLAAFVFSPRLRAYSRHAALAVFLTTLSGWLLLAYFHFRINAAVLLIDPTGRFPAGRFYIPVWVDEEKFLLWTLMVGLLVVTSRCRDKLWRSGLHLVLAAFGMLAYFTSDPFTQPMARFHEGFVQYAALSPGADMQAQAQAYFSMFGKMQYYNSSYMWMHPPLLFLGYATFTLTFLGCLFMLVKGRDGGYEKLAYAYAKPGFIALTVGILLGYPWALEAWKGEPWYYDPKINITIMMWLVYSAYLHSRLYLHRRGMWTTTAVLGYLGFAGVVVTYLSTYVIPGIHSMAGP